mgnify:CR=1 FL=1
MKKGKKTITITVGMMCLILTMIIFIQIKTVNHTNVGELEIMRESELKAEITALKTKTNEVEEKIEATNTKIQEYEDVITKGKEASELLVSELAEGDDILGKTTVTGEGIVITLSSGEKTVTIDDLLELVNILKNSGAEAISINGKRIVYESYIVDIAGYISINGRRTVEPYTVKAIGNMSHLESGIAQKKYGYIDTKISEGKNVVLEKSSDITIDPYSRELKFDYVKEEN